MLMEYDPSVWGPHYWFFIHTIGFTYPELPTDGEKKTYYNLIISMPTFIPNNAVSKNFQSLIDTYPVSSYLNSKESLLKWIHFIHNKINLQIGKEEISYIEFINNYNNEYKPRDIKFKEQMKEREKYIYLFFIILMIGYSIYNVNNM
tara:strand:- start:27 stop:467 length:441 start_codon:yes stop_codon:yes gene_type:complete